MFQGGESAGFSALNAPSDYFCFFKQLLGFWLNFSLVPQSSFAYKHATAIFSPWKAM